MGSKVIWVINEYAGSVHHGMEYRWYYLGKELTKRRYKIYLISASYSHLFFKEPEVYNSFLFENIDGINYVWVKVPKYKHAHDKKRVLKWFIYTLKTLFKLPINRLEKPDVVVVSPIAPFPIITGYRWAKKFNAKLIYEVKDLWPLTLIEIGGYSSNNLFIKFMEFFEKFAYKKSDKVVSVLPLAYKHMLEKGLKFEKFIYIPNGICVEELKEEEPLPERVEVLIPKGKFIVTYAGTFGKANALEYLIESANILKNHKDIHFLLVGKGMEEEKLRKMVKEMKLNNVTFLPPVSKKQIQAILKLSSVCYIGLRKRDIFKYGVSPNKLYDYLYSGKPIIYATDSGNNPIEDAKCGISVEPENPKAIAEGILSLYRIPPEERKEMGKRGKEYVLKYHTYKVIADKYEQVFRE